MEDNLKVTRETNQDNEEEMVDVDVWEFSLDGEEIDELIEELRKLKETKQDVQFDIDETNELLIHYEEEEDNLLEKD